MSPRVFMFPRVPPGPDAVCTFFDTRGQSTLSKWAAFVDTLEVTTLRYHDCLEPYSSGCHWWAIAVSDILTSLGRSLRLVCLLILVSWVDRQLVHELVLDKEHEV